MLIGISDQMGDKTDRLRWEVCQNLILSPINTGFLRPAVATVLTVHGIETKLKRQLLASTFSTLQQCLPFTVLKHSTYSATNTKPLHSLQQCLPFTVLKLFTSSLRLVTKDLRVATVLTVHGIETCFLNLLLRKTK